jgi:hypothetical protein
MRVTATPVEYYNFEFSDETKWRGLRLESPDGEHLLYGYVGRDSPLTDSLFPGDASPRQLLLDVHFLKGGRSNNQVLIERLVSPNWIEPDDTGHSP